MFINSLVLLFAASAGIVSADLIKNSGSTDLARDMGPILTSITKFYNDQVGQKSLYNSATTAYNLAVSKIDGANTTANTAIHKVADISKARNKRKANGAANAAVTAAYKTLDAVRPLFTNALQDAMIAYINASRLFHSATNINSAITPILKKAEQDFINKKLVGADMVFVRGNATLAQTLLKSATTLRDTAYNQTIIAGDGQSIIANIMDNVDAANEKLTGPYMVIRPLY